jgi:hypothetical protein
VAGSSTAAPQQRFVDDSARLNVAFSRAQNHLLVVGHLRSLTAAPVWATIADCARGLPGGLRSTADVDLLAAAVGTGVLTAVGRVAPTLPTGPAT